MTKAHITRALTVIEERTAFLTGLVHGLQRKYDEIQNELDRTTRDLEAMNRAHTLISELAESMPSGYVESELQAMDSEAALFEIAKADEAGILYTEDTVPILTRTGHLQDTDENPGRRLSGILGASSRFTRLAPGIFRLSETNSSETPEQYTVETLGTTIVKGELSDYAPEEDPFLPRLPPVDEEIF